MIPDGQVAIAAKTGVIVGTFDRATLAKLIRQLSQLVDSDDAALRFRIQLRHDFWVQHGPQVLVDFGTTSTTELSVDLAEFVGTPLGMGDSDAKD